MRQRLRLLKASLAVAVCLGAGSAAADPFQNWQLLSSVKITETEQNNRWRAEKEFPPALIAASKDFEIEGFYVPIEAQAYVQSFLMVPDPADCPFCGSSGYGPSLEVTLRKKMPDIAEFSRITVRGQLKLIDDPDTYQSYRLVDALLLVAP